MKKRHHLALTTALALGAISAAWGQDATIINARIAVGDGPIIENGAIVVRAGRIESVQPGRPGQLVGRVIDATGMTAVPGFIDGHKHLNTSPLGEQYQMQDLIENGFTTVLSALGPGDSNLALIKQIDAGQINGPHIIASGRFNLHGTPEQAREAIRAMAAQGIHFTGEVAVTPVPTATPAELAVLRAAIDEGRKVGVQVLVHAVSTPAMVAATEAGIRHEVHLPNKDFMGYDQAAEIVNSGTHVLDLISFGDPLIDVFQKDDLPRFRSGLLWPESIAGANRDEQGRATGTEGAFTLINARRIWDASGGTALGFGSDQNYPVHDVLEHELKSLMVMFSMPDVIRILTINTADFLNMQGQIGTLEPMKQADIVLVQGNPFVDFNDLLMTTVVLKDGRVVLDKRTHPNASQNPDAAATTATATLPTPVPAVGTLTASVARPDQTPVAPCQSLLSARLAQARLTRAAEEPASSIAVAASPAGDDPAHQMSVPGYCAVDALLRPARGIQVQLALRLPDSHWNGALVLLGAGRPIDAEQASGPLHHGYAVASIDIGRQRPRGYRPAQLLDSALHAGALQARSLVSTYYGGTPRFSYWIGADAQDLQVLQSHPGDFDGVVVGASASPQSGAAAAPDLSAFEARGGKVIQYADGASPSAPAPDAVRDYEGVMASGGLQRAMSYDRLFLMPAVHEGDSYRVDWLRVLDEWVQRDNPPDMVLAEHLPPPGLKLPPPPGLVFEPQFGVHTVCAYPQAARVQNGRGETPVDYICVSTPRASGSPSAARPSIR